MEERLKKIEDKIDLMEKKIMDQLLATHSLIIAIHAGEINI